MRKTKLQKKKTWDIKDQIFEETVDIMQESKSNLEEKVNLSIYTTNLPSRLDILKSIAFSVIQRVK